MRSILKKWKEHKPWSYHKNVRKRSKSRQSWNWNWNKRVSCSEHILCKTESTRLQLQQVSWTDYFRRKIPRQVRLWIELASIQSAFKSTRFLPLRVLKLVQCDVWERPRIIITNEAISGTVTPKREANPNLTVHWKQALQLRLTDPTKLS